VLFSWCPLFLPILMQYPLEAFEGEAKLMALYGHYITPPVIFTGGSDRLRAAGAYAADAPQTAAVGADIVAGDVVFACTARGLLKEVFFGVDDDPDVSDASLAGTEKDQVAFLCCLDGDPFAMLERIVILIT